MSVPNDAPGQTPAAEQLVSVDLAAFLPDGVELAGADDPAGAPVAGERAPTPAPATAWRPDLEALDAVEADLDAVDAALQALDDGSYGTCRACAQPISDELLAASPIRTSCAAHP